jgi:glycosidase
MTESGDCQPSIGLASLYERLDAVRAKLKKISAPFLAGQIDLWQFITVAKPFWDEEEEVKDELHRAYFGPDARRDRERERLEQAKAQFELPFGIQHSFRDHQLTAKITWFCTGCGTHDPMVVVFKQPHDVPGADRRTRQLLVLRDIHEGIRRLEAALRKEVTGHPGPPRPPDELPPGCRTGNTSRWYASSAGASYGWADGN